MSFCLKRTYVIMSLFRVQIYSFFSFRANSVEKSCRINCFVVYLQRNKLFWKTMRKIVLMLAVAFYCVTGFAQERRVSIFADHIYDVAKQQKVSCREVVVAW